MLKIESASGARGVLQTARRKLKAAMEEGNPNENWCRWHDALQNSSFPVRRPNGRNIPLYAFWGGKKLDIVKARKEIYIPHLQELYRASPIYQDLLKKVKSGQNVMLVEPDGPLLEEYPNGLEVNKDLLKNLIEVTSYSNGKYRPYGHGYVLALTLLEDMN